MAGWRPAYYRLMLLMRSGDLVETANGSRAYLLRLGRHFDTVGRARGRYVGRRWIELNEEPATRGPWHRAVGSRRVFTQHG